MYRETGAFVLQDVVSRSKITFFFHLYLDTCFHCFTKFLKHIFYAYSLSCACCSGAFWGCYSCRFSSNSLNCPHGNGPVILYSLIIVLKLHYRGFTYYVIREGNSNVAHFFLFHWTIANFPLNDLTYIYHQALDYSIEEDEFVLRNYGSVGSWH